VKSGAPEGRRVHAQPVTFVDTRFTSLKSIGVHVFVKLLKHKCIRNPVHIIVFLQDILWYYGHQCCSICFRHLYNCVKTDHIPVNGKQYIRNFQG